jgi:alkanesulfonate monooxygenase SsuD/methylene tetrahydromethanopterin reductase-like flavin-dependent oxidoreductase (luciferase family)
MGWDHLRGLANAYREGRQQAFAEDGQNELISMREPIMNFTAFTGYIGETEDEALQIGGPIAMSFLGPVLEMFYEPLADRSPSYAYMRDVRAAVGDVVESGDVGALTQRTPNVAVGTVEQVTDKIERLQQLGYNEFGFRIDGHSHQGIMEQLERWGRYIIPHFTMPNSVVPKNMAVAGRIG